MSDNKKELTYFERQRDALISEISISMDAVLNNINSLNRSLEGVLQVGKEFDGLSNQWKSFYDQVAQPQDNTQASKGDKDEDKDKDK